MNWFSRLWRRNQMEQQLEKELQDHIERHTNELIADGYAPEEARGARDWNWVGRSK